MWLERAEGTETQTVDKVEQVLLQKLEPKDYVWDHNGLAKLYCLAQTMHSSLLV